MDEPRRRSRDELLAGLDETRYSPADGGLLEAIVIRPEADQRELLQQCQISAAHGVHGDRWERVCWLKTDDGRSHPDVQICLTNSRVMQLIAGCRERWALAGDNLYVDLDLSRENLQPGQRLQIGSSLIEITAKDHTGCRKFVERYGRDAMEFVNSELGSQLRLRGIYAKVVQDGEVSVGDAVVKT